MLRCRRLQMPPTPKAVLMMLADSVNASQGDRLECYPSITAITEYTCFGRTAVIEAIRWLESAGVVSADRGNGRHTVYALTPEAFVLPEPVRQPDRSASRTGTPPVLVEHETSTPAGPVRETDRSASRTDQYASRTGPVREADSNRKEPEVTGREKATQAAPATPHVGKPIKPKSSKPTGKYTFATWSERLGDAEAIPETDPIFRWCEEAGIPDGYLELAWLAFEAKFEKSPKLYTDWRGTFRNYVREGWLNVWRAVPEGYVLTTVGEQMRRVRDARRAQAAA